MKKMYSDNQGRHWIVTSATPGSVSVRLDGERGGSVRINHDWHGEAPPIEVIRKMERDGL